MDPIHLTADELDYELGLRGVHNVGTWRIKSQCLRDMLKREMAGEHTIAAEGLLALHAVAELPKCDATIESILGKLKDPALGEAVSGECYSRLSHVSGRLRRVISVTPEEQTRAADLLSLVETYLAAMRNPGDAPVRSSQLVHSKPSSPLADIIEVISNGRKSFGSAETCGAESMALQNSLRRSAPLNPGVTPFVPRGSSVAAENPFVQHDQAVVENPFSPNQHSGYSKPTADRPFRSLADLGANEFQNIRDDHGRQSGRSAQQQHLSDFSQRREPREHAAPSDWLGQRDRHHSAGRHTRHEWSHRKTVPVHEWRIYFSGDGQGMHLCNFLSELSMFQESEGVSDAELLSSIGHLLWGRARLWFRPRCKNFRSWNEFVAEIKQDFLPPKYDYRLLTSISNRRQKTNETFSEYLNVMQALFDYLTIPIDNQHRLSIIEENMLPKYALAVSAIEVISLKQLSDVCRRVDYAGPRPVSAFMLDDMTALSRVPSRPGRFREVNAMETFPESEVPAAFASLSMNESSSAFQRETTAGAEVLAVRQSGNREQQGRSDSGERKCFNCLRTGHIFADCREARADKFCYRCGSRNFSAFSCQDCAKNDSSDSARRGGVQGPPK